MLGKPLIMVKNTGMSEVVATNNFGELIDYNRESLQKGIENLVKRRKEWSDISHEMKALYEESYSWAKMEKRITNLYSNL